MALQICSLFVGGILGWLSFKADPANPADQGWQAEARLIWMLLGITDITMAYFYFTLFYQICRVSKEGHDGKSTNPIHPNTSWGKWTRNLVFLVLILWYFGAGGFLCYLYFTEKINYATFVFPIYIAVTSYGGVTPILVLIFTKAKNYVNSRYKVTYTLLVLGILISWACRIYRGVHGILMSEIIFDMLTQDNLWWLILYGVLYFVGNILPYFFFVSHLIFPSFFLFYKEEGKYQALMYRNYELSGSNASLT